MRLRRRAADHVHVPPHPPAHPSMPAPKRPRTAAARLLAAVVADQELTLDALATPLQLPVSALEACLDGTHTLALDVQMRLAALATMMAPRHERQARALYAQAQAALRMAESAGERHMTYPREFYK